MFHQYDLAVVVIFQLIVTKVALLIIVVIVVAAQGFLHEMSGSRGVEMRSGRSIHRRLKWKKVTEVVRDRRRGNDI